VTDNSLRYVSKQTDSDGRVHYYFKRAGFPRVRLPKPDAFEFDHVYRLAAACKTLENFLALRQAIGMRPWPQRRPSNPNAEAIIAWAEHRPLTDEQHEIVRRRLGLTDVEIEMQCYFRAPAP
jgi:hypothetical protein